MNPRLRGRAYAASKTEPRQFATIDGQQIAFIMAGEGSPAIVFLSGAGMDLDSWFLVYPEAARLTTALAFDRPGVGRSGPQAVDQTASAIVGTLRGLLGEAGVGPPHVLVAHSIGGLVANLFARQFPNEVAGLVLVDAASPDEVESQPPRGRAMRVVDRVLGIVGRDGRQGGLREVDVVDRTVRELAAAPPFPDLPLVVVTGTKRMRFVPEAAFAGHLAHQARLVGLSPRGRQLMAPRSGHFPQIDDPEIVFDAIRDVIAAART
jgi:pimeloyl-ACP methyl ester carboxylesterase